MSLISHNIMAFYPISVGFSLKTNIFIGEHCYTIFNVKNKIFNLAPSFNVVYDFKLSITSVSTPPLNVDFLTEQCSCQVSFHLK